MLRCRAGRQRGSRGHASPGARAGMHVLPLARAAAQRAAQSRALWCSITPDAASPTRTHPPTTPPGLLPSVACIPAKQQPAPARPPACRAQDDEEYEVEDLKIDSDDELDESTSASPARSPHQGSKRAIAAALSQRDLADTELLVPKPKWTAWGVSGSRWNLCTHAALWRRQPQCGWPGARPEHVLRAGPEARPPGLAWVTARNGCWPDAEVLAPAPRLCRCHLGRGRSRTLPGSASASQPARLAAHGQPPRPPQYVVDILTVIPWVIVLGLTWLVNQWQRLWRPVNMLVYAINGKLDLSAPVILGPINWLYDTVSLALHVADVAIKFGLLKVGAGRAVGVLGCWGVQAQRRLCSTQAARVYQAAWRLLPPSLATAATGAPGSKAPEQDLTCARLPACLPACLPAYRCCTTTATTARRCSSWRSTCTATTRWLSSCSGSWTTGGSAVLMSSTRPCCCTPAARLLRGHYAARRCR
jgi:hypothetical protein